MEHHLQDLTQLAIIGNGFDLAHGYHTRYVDFTESVGDDFFRKYRHYINNYCPQMDWYRFEECADQLTVPFNAEDLRSDTAANEVIKPFNKDFQKIKIALIDYLKKEQIRIPFSKKVNVSSRLSPSTLALTFNYTNLCENYIRNIIYIHGSLAENEIVLGYDPVSPFCFSSFDTIRWYKGFCRERLNFCRYLMQQKQLFPENCLYHTLCDEYLPFVGSFHKDETIVSGVEKKDSIELYRYLFFTITYGENGMRAEIQQSTGGSIQVQPEDVLSQRFHVFIAFVSHPDTTDAIMLTEALGRRSVAEVMRKWLKNILRTIDGENYTVSPIETPDAEALKTFIKNNRWEEIRLSKKAVADENGQLPDYTEEVRVFKFDKRRPQTGLKMIQDIFHRAFPDEIEEITHSQEVDNFNPEMIKFKVKGIRNSRTFTVDRPLTGGIREILDPSVIDADGYTSDTKILNEFKRIFEEQHMPR